VTRATGLLSTVAGSPGYGTTGDGGPAPAAYFGYPRGVAVDASGNVFIADFGGNRVRIVPATTLSPTPAPSAAPTAAPSTVTPTAAPTRSPPPSRAPTSAPTPPVLAAGYLQLALYPSAPCAGQAPTGWSSRQLGVCSCSPLASCQRLTAQVLAPPSSSP